jgi:hypothetical protein
MATASHLREDAVSAVAVMTRQRDPFRIPQAGFEVAPLAGLAAIDLPFMAGDVRGNVNGGQHLVESSLGGVAVYAIYQALLTALRTEALRKRGRISRTVQVRMISSTVWEATKQGAAVSLVLGVILIVFPWLTLPLALLGVVGMGKASLDLFHAFWDGLDPSQQQDLLAASRQAGVNLRRLISGDQRGARPA